MDVTQRKTQTSMGRKGRVYRALAGECLVDSESVSGTIRGKGLAMSRRSRIYRATLAEVKEKLEIWYGVTIEIHGQTNYERHFTGSFKNENLQNIMESLSFTFGFSYQQMDGYVSVQF